MATRILINGAGGRMGRVADRAIRSAVDLTVAGAAHRTDDLARRIADTKPDVVLDLTTPAAVYANACTIIDAGAVPVIGTSGLSSDQVDALASRCVQAGVGGCVVPNFSITAVLMMRFAAEAARHLPDAEIVESHHPSKVDAPSGTARHTADLIAQNRVGGDASVPVHAIRLPGRLAHQQTLFGSEGELLTIQSDAIDRSAFGPGICLACRRAPHLDRLVVGLDALM